MKHTKKIAIYALTRQGILLGSSLLEILPYAELHVPRRLQNELCIPFHSLTKRVAELFTQCHAHIFITAAGIATRSIAPHLESKAKDPGVLVLDQQGKYVISLLSGHLGGANALAQHIATQIKATAIITTATDSQQIPSIDMLAMQAGLVIGDLSAVKNINAALLDGKTVQIYDPAKHLNIENCNFFYRIKNQSQWDNKAAGVWIDWRTNPAYKTKLRLYPSCIYAGIGYRKGVTNTAIKTHIHHVLHENGIAIQSLAGLSTIEEKRYEQGLLDAAKSLALPISYFSKKQLSKVHVPTPSALVKQHMGIDSVCEAAAILASNHGSLIIPKSKSKNITCALALSKS